MQYLPACIESMLAQDCTDWKCVFVDGYSTDGSWEYMQQFASDSRFLLLRGLKQGMYADWNECLRYVDTEYFYFLTSDDTCFPELVSTTVNALDTYSDVDACHFQFCLIDEIGKIVQSSESITQQYCDLYCEVNQYPHLRSGLCEFMMHFVYRAIYTTITSLVFRRCLIDKLGGFATTYGSIGDYDWTMRLGLFTDVLFIPKLLSTWRVYQEQASRGSTRLQHQDYLLKIADANLKCLMNQQLNLMLNKPINRQQLLCHLIAEHASSLYEQAFLSKSLNKFIIFSREALSQYPLHPLKKVLNRLSKDQLFIYPSRRDLALKIIDNYGLKWMPQMI